MPTKLQPVLFQAALLHYISANMSGADQPFWIDGNASKISKNDDHQTLQIQLTLNNGHGYDLRANSTSLIDDLSKFGFTTKILSEKTYPDEPSEVEALTIAVTMPYSEHTFNQLRMATENQLLENIQTTGAATIKNIREQATHNRSFCAKSGEHVNRVFSQLGFSGDFIDTQKIRTKTAQAFAPLDRLLILSTPAPTAPTAPVEHHGKGIITLNDPDKGLDSGARLG